jgi:5-methylcytosine-specific restriction endonuclease McrA
MRITKICVIKCPVCKRIFERKLIDTAFSKLARRKITTCSNKCSHYSNELIKNNHNIQEDLIEIKEIPIKKSSIIYEVSKEKLINIINKSNTFGEVLSFFGLINKGNNNKTLKERIKSEKIDIQPLIERRKIYSQNKRISLTKIPLEKILIQKSEYSSGLRIRLFKENILQNKCSICGLDNTWMNKPITLQLDHINGDKKDNRIENLRILCPNCHSQTINYAGRKLIRKRCVVCNRKINNKTGRKICILCYKKLNKEERKITAEKYNIIHTGTRKVKNRPSKEELEKLINTMPMTHVGKLYNITDSAIKKWCKNYGIILQNRRGYWQKIKYNKPINDISKLQ